MSTKIKSKRESLENKVLRGGRLAIRNLITERKKNNDYLIVSRNGKVVKLRARSIK